VTGKEIQAIRQRRGESVEQFAELLGRSVGAIYDWEQGRRRPDRFLQAALDALDRGECPVCGNALLVRSVAKRRSEYAGSFSTSR
jgi:transcriptional regulator with XRE-family HTH domain